MNSRMIASGHILPAVSDARPQIAHSRSIRSPFRSPVQTSKSRTQQTRCSATETKGGETRRQALGSIVIETNEDLPEPPEKDFWEGGAWEWFGKLTIAVVPLLIAAALGTGIFAAATYNTGADKVLLPAGEDSPAQIVDSQQ